MIQTVVSNASAPEYGQATISFPIREEDYPSAVSYTHLDVYKRQGTETAEPGAVGDGV